MNNKKILHIIDSLGLGGAQTYVKGIFETQQENKNIFLYTLRKREINIEVNHSNIYKYNSRSLYSFFPIFELKKLIKVNNIQILHCHLFRSQVFGWILKKIFFPNIKLIFHEHGEIFENGFKYTFLMKKFQNILNCYIAVSEATKQKLIENAKIKENKIKVLYNFVDIDKFKKLYNFDIKNEREKYGLNEDDFVIGFIGRLSEVKGCEFLIRTLPKLDFDYKVIIAGDGPLKSKLIELSKKLGVYEKVLFIGFIENIVDIYQILDICVVPSLLESFGLSIIESMSAGIPVISSNTESTKEIIKDGYNGLVFPLKNSEELSKKITILYSNFELRDKLIINGKEEVKNYSINKYLFDLKNIYVK